MVDHPNKEIREAIQFALQRGWRVKKAGGRAHIWGQIFCPFEGREGCIVRIFCTPRSAGNHAKRIKAEVEKCPHFVDVDE